MVFSVKSAMKAPITGKKFTEEIIMFELNKWYRLNKTLKNEFIDGAGDVDNARSNKGIVEFLEKHGDKFKVTGMYSTGTVKEIIMVDGTSSESHTEEFLILICEKKYFVDIKAPRVNFWEADKSYKAVDLDSLRKSAINTRFINTVGNKPFKVLTLQPTTQVPESRTHTIEYIDDNNELQTFYITFIESELKYFKEVESVSNDKEVEIDSEICELEVETKELMKIKVEGAIVFRVEDEADRLRAIEALTNMRWEK